MPTDDDEPRPRATSVNNPPLDRLGIDELRRYIAGLQVEIGRAEAEIARKDALRSAADSIFRVK